MGRSTRVAGRISTESKRFIVRFADSVVRSGFMKISRALVVRWFFLGSLVLCGFVLATVRVAAQTGDKAVYGTNNNLAASSAWVDATAFCPSGGTSNCGNVDFCSVVSQAITKLLAVSPTGGVVDAARRSPGPCHDDPPGL